MMFSRTLTKMTLAGPLYRQRLMTFSRSLSSQPITVSVSDAEKASRSLTLQNLELATRALHRDGLVVLSNAIDSTHLDILNQKMKNDALTLQSAGDASPYNYNKGNIQQDPPLTAQFFDPEIIINALATQVTTSVLGPKPRLSFVSGNTALPPTPSSPPQSQPVHADADFAHPECPFALVVNVPLVDMTELNGSTEVWLGTHSTTSLRAQEGAHGERASGRIRAELLEARRGERAPCQPFIKQGSVVIRDLRLWHAGKPNFGEDVRVMLAMIHFAPWFRNAMTFKISEDLKSVLEAEGSGLQIQAEFVKDEVVRDTYLQGKFGNAYDFDQKEPLEEFF